MYFLSSFPPSTIIQNGKLVENNIVAGVTAIEIWDCALESFNTDDCSITAIVSDKNDIGLITKSAATFLTQYTGNTGVWIMISGYSNCLNHYYDIEKTGFALSTDNNFVGLINNLNVIHEHQLDETMSDMLLTKGLENLNASEKEEYAISLGFNNLEDLNSFEEVNYNIVANFKNDFYSSGYVKEDHSLIFLSALKYYKKESIVISNNSSLARKAAPRGVTGLTSCQKAILWNAATTIGLIACGTGWLCALAIAAKIGSLDAVMDSCAHKPFL